MPDTVAEVAVVERSAVGADEDELGGAGTAPSQQVLAQHPGDSYDRRDLTADVIFRHPTPGDLAWGASPETSYQVTSIIIART